MAESLKLGAQNSEYRAALRHNVRRDRLRRSLSPQHSVQRLVRISSARPLHRTRGRNCVRKDQQQPLVENWLCHHILQQRIRYLTRQVPVPW